ncbi:Nesprin-2 [Liparis tanakae]|uniref:Nesprin-2 n=1 Tax=Liparis tanakae TaxID=230148 RepID=A0A4Z2I186_9TELE|nr:Nesprin-2 [Liparis tanakae]
MPEFPPDPPPSERHGDASPASEGSGQEVRGMERFPDPSESPHGPASYPVALNGEESQQAAGGWRRDEEPPGCGHLERRWFLWHQFMNEHAQLDTWLRLAEQAVGSPRPAHLTYVTAREDMRTFERLRCEAGPRLVQLDGLTRRNRALARLFQGVMQARLLALARDCGQRWDDVNAKLESITERLKLFVSEWEGFEAEREELALRLAELDALIQRSDPADAQRVESRLLELLRRCSLVYSNIARTHTRLLSMRLVFEDDWVLPQATDSGCPSETLLEEEVDSTHQDIPVFPKHANVSPAHEHQGLEWDPSVDIGRSVSHDDADSLYFSASIGLCHRDGVKRLSYFSSLSSQTDSDDITNQEADLQLEDWLDHAQLDVPSPVATQGGRTRPKGQRWATSTPDGQDGEPVCFDGRRVRAWLGVQGPAPLETTTSCSKAVQTAGQMECRHRVAPHQLPPHLNDTQQPLPGPAPRWSRDLKASSDWATLQYGSTLQVSRSGGTSPALLFLFLAAALTLLAGLIWVVLVPPGRCFHLTLSYVNGPPPT